MNMKCLSSLLINFNLKSILLAIRIATPSCSLGPFDWKIFSQLFTLRKCLSLKLRCIFCMQQKNEWSFHISVSLCLFTGELEPLILRDSNDQWLSVPVIFWFCVGGDILCAFPLFGFCCCGIIYCLWSVGVANFLGLEFYF